LPERGWHFVDPLPSQHQSADLIYTQSPDNNNMVW
jgi:hypothetical protein